MNFEQALAAAEAVEQMVDGRPSFFSPAEAEALRTLCGFVSGASGKVRHWDPVRRIWSDKRPESCAHVGAGRRPALTLR